MNKKFKNLFRCLSLLAMVIVISCSGVEKKSSSKKDYTPTETPENNHLYYAYKNYTLACIALNNDSYNEAEIYLKDAIQHDQDSAYLLAKLVYVLVENGKVEEGLNYAERAVDIEPDNLRFRELLADIYSRLEKFDSAVSQYRKILFSDPSNKDIRLYLIAHLIRLKKFDTALEELSILIENEPELLMAYYYKGKTYMELKEYDKAKKTFLKALDINSEFAPVLFELAELYSKVDETDTALITYKKILNLYPSNIIARERLIELYYDSGYDELAEKYINEIKKIIDPGDVERKRLGLIYLRRDKFNESISEFKSILSVWPDDQEARYYLGAAMEESGDLENAYKNFNFIKLDSEKSVSARIHMAYILEKQEKSDQAITLLKETINQKRDKPELYLMLESVYEKKEDYLSAKDTLEDGLRYNENNIDLLFRLGIVLDKLDKNEECLKRMEMVVKIEPNHAEALNYIGYTYADKGIHLDRAQELIEKAIKNRPNAGFIIDSLGWLYFKKGYYDKAIIELKKAIKLAPEDPSISEHLGDVYFKMSDFINALKIYKSTLSLKDAEKDRLNKKIKDIERELSGDNS